VTVRRRGCFSLSLSRCSFEVNLVIAGEVIVIGAFGITAVNARMRALLGVTVSALAGTAVSAVVYVIDSYMPSGILGWY